MTSMSIDSFNWKLLARSSWLQQSVTVMLADSSISWYGAFNYAIHSVSYTRRGTLIPPALSETMSCHDLMSSRSEVLGIWFDVIDPIGVSHASWFVKTLVPKLHNHSSRVWVLRDVLRKVFVALCHLTLFTPPTVSAPIEPPGVKQRKEGVQLIPERQKILE